MDNEVLPLLKKGDHLSSIAKINDYISTANLSPLNLQRAYQVMARINVDMGEITQAINLLEEVIKIAPQSPDAEKARASIKALKQ